MKIKIINTNNEINNNYRDEKENKNLIRTKNKKIYFAGPKIKKY